jgi:hypothetical protein
MKISLEIQNALNDSFNPKHNLKKICEDFNNGIGLTEKEIFILGCQIGNLQAIENEKTIYGHGMSEDLEKLTDYLIEKL